MREASKSLMTRLDEGAERRFDGAFFTALGIVLMLRTLTYVDTVAAVRVAIGAELNPLAQLDTSFVAEWDVLLALAVISLTILVAHKETRVVCFSFIIALVSADFAFDMVQYLELPPVNLASAQVYALVCGVAAMIPFTVGFWQLEVLGRKARGERPLAGGKLQDLELTM